MTYLYDVRDQLTQESRTPGVATSWTYDIAGRRTIQSVAGVATSYAYDRADQLLNSYSSGLVTTYAYDVNGSTLLVQTPTNQLTTYAWDALNRLRNVTLPNGISSNHVYRFDDLLDNIQTAQGTRQLIWEGGSVLATVTPVSGGELSRTQTD